MKISLAVIELEPGTHIMRKTIREVSRVIHEIPDDECKDVAPEFGIYVVPAACSVASNEHCVSED